MDKIFVLDLNNDILSIESLITKLDSGNEIVRKLHSIVQKIKVKCQDSINNKVQTQLDLFSEIKTTTKKFEKLNASFMLSAKPTIFTNKNKIEDFISHICRNSIAAGADQIRFEIRDHSLIIRDNGKCSAETVNKLRYEFNGGKLLGLGEGSHAIYDFCKEHKIKVEFHLGPSIDFRFKRTSLAIKLILNEGASSRLSP